MEKVKVSIGKEVKVSVDAEQKTKEGNNMKTVLENAAKLGSDILVIGGATVLSGALAMFVKERSKHAFNEAMRQQREIRRMSKEKVVNSLNSFK